MGSSEVGPGFKRAEVQSQTDLAMESELSKVATVQDMEDDRVWWSNALKPGVRVVQNSCFQV